MYKKKHFTLTKKVFYLTSNVNIFIISFATVGSMTFWLSLSFSFTSAPLMYF